MEQTSEKCICGIYDGGVQMKNVKINELHDFHGHPFKVEYDLQLLELSKSIGGGTLILGIDHGYGNIKTAHRVFPTALMKVHGK